MSRIIDEIEYKTERLERILIDALRVHAILVALDEFENTLSWDEDEQWDRPNEHRSLLMAYGSFFRPVRAALLRDLHMQTAKLLIGNRDSLFTSKLVRDVFDRDKQIRRALADDSGHGWFYHSMDASDRERVEVEIAKYQHLILKLALNRNRRLAHEDKRSDEPNLLSLDELKSLLELAQLSISTVRGIYFGVPNSGANEYYLERIKSDVQLMLEELYLIYNPRPKSATP